MKILLSADSHGKILDSIEKDCELIIVAGDFSEGDKLRQAIFNKGDMEEAKKDIVESAKKFISNLPKDKTSVISLGNVEEPVKDEIIQVLKNNGINYKQGLMDIKGLKILSIDFFVEEWWAMKYKPDNPNTLKRAIEDEKRLKDIIKEIKDLDIIVSHVPPFGILDSNPNPPKFLPKSYQGNMGSKILLDLIKEKQPKLVICSHIHIPGIIKQERTTIINPGEKQYYSIED